MWYMPKFYITLKAGIERALHEEVPRNRSRNKYSIKTVKLIEHIMNNNKDRNTRIIYNQLLPVFSLSNWTDGKVILYYLSD